MACDNAIFQCRGDSLMATRAGLQEGNGMRFPEDTIQRIWEKGKEVAGYDPGVWRKDECGAWIGRRFYGNRDTEYGWDVGWTKVVVKNGKDNLSGLCPLQWENCLSRQAGRLECVVSSVYEKNVRVMGLAATRNR